MTLPLPDLDDRRWTDLVDEGRGLIPVHAPGWTDHNVTDPGITLIELLAYIAETDIYRLNRVPDAHRRKFLALAGVTARAPRGARTVVAFELDDTAPATQLPAGLQIEANTPNGAVRFRTRRDLQAVAGQPVAFQVGAGSGAGGGGGNSGVSDLSDRLRRGAPFSLFGDHPEPGAAFYIGLRLPAGPPTVPVSLYLNVEGVREDERRRLLEEAHITDSRCRPPKALVDCTPAEAEPGEPGDDEPGDDEPGDDVVLDHHSVRLVWEAWTAGDQWQPLAAPPLDLTRAFTLSGPVDLVLPANMVPRRLGHVEEELYYLRCRWLDGAFDIAPRVEDLLLNGVEVEQQESVGPEHLGEGSGLPRQRLEVSRPLVCGEIHISTLENGEVKGWTERSDFDASGRRDRHFVADRDLGELTFGDGERGRTIPEVPVTASYHSTAGPAGNLEAGSLEHLAATVHNQSLVDIEMLKGRLKAIHQPRDAKGGAPGETLDQAAARAFEGVEQTARAVTLDDYEARAMEVPGIRLARVAARANLHPAFPCFKAPGIVTVIVVPHLPARRPIPSPALRRTVAAYLHRRRPLATRVEVVGPEWVEITVRTKVRACPGFNKNALVDQLRRALDRFFHPLQGGPEADGWPFGRDVYRSEVLQALDETTGTDHVLSLELIGANGEVSCGNLCVPPAGLIVAGQHEIEVV